MYFTVRAELSVSLEQDTLVVNVGESSANICISTSANGPSDIELAVEFLFIDATAFGNELTKNDILLFTHS